MYVYYCAGCDKKTVKTVSFGCPDPVITKKCSNCEQDTWDLGEIIVKE